MSFGRGALSLLLPSLRYLSNSSANCLSNLLGYHRSGGNSGTYLASASGTSLQTATH